MAKKKNLPDATTSQLAAVRRRVTKMEQHLRVVDANDDGIKRELADVRSAQRELAQSMVRLSNQMDELSRAL